MILCALQGLHGRVLDCTGRPVEVAPAVDLSALSLQERMASISAHVGAEKAAAFNVCGTAEMDLNSIAARGPCINTEGLGFMQMLALPDNICDTHKVQGCKLRINLSIFVFKVHVSLFNFVQNIIMWITEGRCRLSSPLKTPKCVA